MNNLFNLIEEAKEVFGEIKGNRKTRRTKKKTTTKRRKKAKKDLNMEMENLDIFSLLFNNSFDDNNSEELKNNINETIQDSGLDMLDLLDSLTGEDSSNLAGTTSKKSTKKILNDLKNAVLNLLVSRDTYSTTKKDRYNDNLNAIEVIKSLDLTGEKATTTQQKTLSRYVGWGGLSTYFSDKKTSEALKVNLGDYYDSARRSVNTSFYTDAVIVKYMYKVLQKLGFEKGTIIDPALGTGHMFKYATESLFYSSKIKGIEMDTLTSKIATNLYQSIEVINARYEETELKDDSFDLALSNIPFSNTIIFDKYDKEFNGKGLFVHDYYFLKSIKKVRDKGLIAFVTTSGVMDKKSNEIRKSIDEYCNFLGAVRLPAGAFKDTSVVVDIIFLQKDLNKNVLTEDNMVDEDEAPKKEVNKSWLESKKFFDNKDLCVNEYFINNPEMVIGDIVLSTNQFGECLSVKFDGNLKSDSFNKTLKYFPSEVYVTPLTDEYMYEEEELLICTDENIKNGEFIIKEEKIYQRQGGKLIPSFYVGDRNTKLKLYIAIKDITKDIIREQLNGCEDEVLEELQSDLNSLYDTFVAKFGFINNRANKSLLNECILYSMVSALENYNFNDKTYTKADIFSKRTIGVQKEFIPTDIEDAICISLATFGEIDIEFIADKLNRDYDSTRDELIEKELVFIDPKDNTNCIFRDKYLSGYVKEKLNIAREFVNSNPLLAKNIKALELVQPEYVTDVKFNFASTWIPLSIKENFIKTLLNVDVNHELALLYTDYTGYNISFRGWLPYAVNEVEWGTPRRSALKIAEAILNQSDLTVVDIVDVNGKDKRVKNAEQTQLALNMAEKWKVAFINYINSDIELLKEITDLYNDLFNGYREREYFNIFKGINTNPNITLREHQLKAISRLIQSDNNTLLCHSVGTVNDTAYIKKFVYESTLKPVNPKAPLLQ